MTKYIAVGAISGALAVMLVGLLVGQPPSVSVPTSAQSGSYTPYFMGCTPGTELKVTMPEGQAWGSRETYLVLANPGTETAVAMVTSPGFATRAHAVTVEPDARVTTPMRQWLRAGVTEFVVTVSLPLPISVELISWDTATWTTPVISPMTEACW